MRIAAPAIALLAIAVSTAAVAQGQAPAPPDAAQSDPLALGLMQGSPVPRDRQVRADDGSAFQFPKTRWALSNMQALYPTVTVRREGPVSPLPEAKRDDLDSIPVTLPDGRKTTFGESFDINYTDGLIILHQGRVIYERYAGALDAGGRHIAMSATKSFVGTLALLLRHDGKLNENRTAGFYVPELATSGFGNASIWQLLDMRTAIDFNEDYAGVGTGLSDVTKMVLAVGMAPAPAGYQGPDGGFAFAASLKSNGSHGGEFVYRTPNTMALQWVVERAGRAPLAEQLAERIWKPMGMEQEASIIVDHAGTSFGGGGMNASLRDMARFGEMIRNHGRWNGRQILPEDVVQAILAPGDMSAFANANYPGLEGGSYANQWWHRPGGQTMAVGVNGQMIYIDPANELVIARFASNPVASNRAIHPTTLPAFDALAEYLGRQR